MAKTSPQTPDTGAMGAPSMDAAASVGNAMVESMVNASQAYVDGLVAASQETVEFANRRLGTDVETCSRLANCKSYEDMAQVQQDWVATTLQDYSQEWLKMAQVFAERMPGGGTAAAARKPAKPAAKAKPNGEGGAES